MNSNTEDLPAKVAAIIDQAWPCFVHYANPRDLVEDAGELERLLSGLYGLKPTIERTLPDTVPAEGAIAEAMTMGHQQHPACVALAIALARCIPALTQTVREDRCPTFTLNGEDEWSVRAALADIHHLHHRLDPTHQDDTPLIEALCTKPATPQPVEIGTDWQYMVRLTHVVMGGTASALDEMPMRCFIELAHARNWAVMQAMWDCLVLDDGRDMLDDPRHLSLVAELERFDGPQEQVWRMPSTDTDLHLAPRTSLGGESV